MAKKPNPKSSYVVLDSARVYYDQNNDTVHLTVKDKEIPEGIHLSLNASREDEKRLRRVLDDHGLLNKSDLMKEYHLLQQIAKEFNRGAAHLTRDARSCIPFGFSAEYPMSWNIRKDPHLLVIGSPGAGKSVALQNIAEYVLEHGEDENMELLYSRNSFEPKYTLDETIENIKQAKAIVEERYSDIVKSMAKNEEYLPSSKIILIVDGFSHIADEDVETAKMLLGIVRMGSQVGVHVVAASFGPTSNLAESPEEYKIVRQLDSAFPATFQMRHYSPSNSFSAAERALFKQFDSGCGMFINSAGKNLVQIIPYKKVLEGPGWVLGNRKYA